MSPNSTSANKTDSLLRGQSKFPSKLVYDSDTISVTPLSTPLFTWNVAWIGVAVSPLIYVFYYTGLINVFFPLNIFFTGMIFWVLAGLFFSYHDWKPQNKVTFNLSDQKITVENISTALSGIISPKEFAVKDIAGILAKKSSQNNPFSGYQLELLLRKNSLLSPGKIILLKFDDVETPNELLTYLKSFDSLAPAVKSA